MIALQWFETHVVKGKGALRVKVIASNESEARRRTEAMFGPGTVAAVVFKPLEVTCQLQLQ